VLYFYLLDAAAFQGQITPALAASWGQRSFAPCQRLSTALVPQVQAFAARYGTGDGISLLAEVGRGLPFRREFWQHLVGEVLLYSAREMPDVQVMPETLCRLLAPERCGEAPRVRAHFTPIQQAHYGTRDLVFSGAHYRPENAGYNDVGDVARLARYLASVDPGAWAVADLELPPGAEDAADELAFVRECFLALRELYRRADSQGWLVVCEDL
jgi:hypothetical protein